MEERLLHYLPRRPDGECWLFDGCLTYEGYGVLSAGKKQYRAHRLAWELWEGPIPDGLTIDHVKARGCTSRTCCNPAHLEPVTNAENIRRGDSPHARNARKTTCVHGHPFDSVRRVGDKTYRACSTCAREASRRHGGYSGVGPGRRGAPRDAAGRFVGRIWQRLDT